MSKSNILSKKDQAQSSAEISAVIAMALRDLYGEVHDVENAILTFGKNSKAYSPWSSKIYNMRRLPEMRR
jgi:hypothetical protein